MWQTELCFLSFARLYQYSVTFIDFFLLNIISHPLFHRLLQANTGLAFKVLRNLPMISQKAQMEAEGHTAVHPSEFLLSEDSSSLLIILRNEDIAEHICEVNERLVPKISAGPLQ